MHICNIPILRNGNVWDNIHEIPQPLATIGMYKGPFKNYVSALGGGVETNAGVSALSKKTVIFYQSKYYVYYIPSTLADG